MPGISEFNFEYYDGQLLNMFSDAALGLFIEADT